MKNNKQSAAVKSLRYFALSLSLSLPAQAWAAETADLLVLYTPDALQTRNGGDINARIASYVAYANQAYANSQVDLRLRLVGAEMLDVPYTTVTSQNLDQLRRNSQVAQLRRKYGADLVTLLNLRHATSGGYVCGIGYLPSGDSRSGAFYSNASSVAFNLVGIDCGVSTLAHELGHNMGLGHSQLQGSNGGVWPWARGYGVQGVFSTIMAYPQSFGTRNQLALFSNPAVRECEGLECGVDRSRSNGADAATSLNSLATQIAGFMPTVTAVDNEPEPTDPGGEPQPGSDPACRKPAVSSNLVGNGEFDTLEGWRSAFGLSQLNVTQLQNDDCVDNALVVTRRSEPHSSAYYPLANKLRGATPYRLEARLGIRSGSREDVRVALYVQDSAGSRYDYLDPLSVTASELTKFTREFELPLDSSVGILLYGPPAGVDILADSFSLVAGNSPAPADPDPTPGANTLVNEPFEGTANGWRSYYGGTLSYSTQAAAGNSSLRISARASRYTGASLDLTGVLQNGGRYAFETEVMVAGAQDNVQVWLYYVDQTGGHWQSLASDTVSANSWQPMTGAFVLNAQGAVSQARISVLGPARGRDFYLDNVRIERQ